MGMLHEGGREFFLWLSPLFERRSTVLGRFKLSLCSIVSVDSGFTIAISASVTDAKLKTWLKKEKLLNKKLG